MSAAYQQAERTALVTGGTDGIGKEVARGLARAGHRVIIIGRDAEKGVRAAREIQQAARNPNVEFLQADLSLMREAERVADEVGSRWAGLNCLVHSAGMVSGRRELTDEGIESNFATNYLSRFVLTRKLLPLMKAVGEPGTAARIVVISGAATTGKIYFDDINLISKFGLLRMVEQSCRANDVFTVEQARRLASGYARRVTITCLKMGVVKTNIRNRPDFPRWMKILVPLIMDPLLGQTAEQAAESALKLLLSRAYEGVTGALFLKIREFKQIEPLADIADPKIGLRLWELSERLTASPSNQLTNQFSQRIAAPLKGDTWKDFGVSHLG
jgi:NAD(P)-dependent dehydrogenase (short-subunit alcohol dehydrogenase family)